jgi:hypothetical protein
LLAAENLTESPDNAPDFAIFGVLSYRYYFFSLARRLADPMMRPGKRLMKERRAND